MNFRPRRSEEPEIGMAPLIDVVFLILIFFAVTITFSRESALRIDLPEASPQAAEQARELLEVVVDRRGHYFIDGREVVGGDAATLRRALLQSAGDRAGKPVVISADADAPYQAVITLMDVAGQAGFSGLSLTTRQPAGAAAR